MRDAARAEKETVVKTKGNSWRAPVVKPCRPSEKGKHGGWGLLEEFGEVVDAVRREPIFQFSGRVLEGGEPDFMPRREGLAAVEKEMGACLHEVPPIRAATARAWESVQAETLCILTRQSVSRG